MPRGYRADGTPLGGYAGNPGTGRRQKGERVKISLRLTPEIVAKLARKVQAMRAAGETDVSLADAAIWYIGNSAEPT